MVARVEALYLELLARALNDSQHDRVVLVVLDTFEEVQLLGDPLGAVSRTVAVPQTAGTFPHAGDAPLPLLLGGALWYTLTAHRRYRAQRTRGRALENRAMTGTTLLVDGGQHLMPFERDFSWM